MYVRVRRVLGGVTQSYSVTAFQRSYKLLQDLYALQNQVDDLINNGAVQTPVIGATLEQLPVRLDNRFNYNAAVYIQDNVVIAGNYTFVVATRGNRHPIIMRKENLTGVWTYFDLHYVTGNPLASPTEEDSHNVYSLGVTKDGYLIVSGNMHAKPCRAVISNAPYDITAWTAISYTASTEVTYPRFVKYPDGTTQAFWRQGVSAAGQYYSALFNDTTRTFGPVFQIAATDLNANAYEQRLGVGRDGSLHFCFGLRVNANTADANRGLYYAKSMDKGLTWTNAAGTINYPAPLTEANSEKIADIPIYSGYVNQNGGACDYDSHYHTCLWQTDDNNHTQIVHIWFDGSDWHEEFVSKFTFKVNTTQPLLDGTLSRPAIGCNKYGKTWIFYRTTEMGRDGEIRAIDVSEPGNPVEHIVTGFNMGTLELAVNTNTLMNDNQLLMLATRGAIGYADPMYSRYTDEPGYLLVAVMP
ncbi:BNR-4 repeat-containing protein [Klebsiella aerogenes]|uniref:BNR-4 repeat-containing protein n=1 Tax=Klebsiella aerogenes TaxID=548 RepID=UPI0039A759F1